MSKRLNLTLDESTHEKLETQARRMGFRSSASMVCRLIKFYLDPHPEEFETAAEEIEGFFSEFEEMQKNRFEINNRI